MTKEEAKAEINKVFEPAFANYIITALTEGATPSERKTGRWARQTDDYHDYYECENCGIAVGLDDVKNYCPKCGLRMEGAEE